MFLKNIDKGYSNNQILKSQFSSYTLHCLNGFVEVGCTAFKPPVGAPVSNTEVLSFEPGSTSHPASCLFMGIAQLLAPCHLHGTHEFGTLSCPWPVCEFLTGKSVKEQFNSVH